ASEIQTIFAADGSGKCVPTTVAPFITSQPVDLEVPVGSPATFTVGAGGTKPLFYQWYFDATNPISGGTNATLTIPSAQASDEGIYSARVSNAAGSAGTVFAF